MVKALLRWARGWRGAETALLIAVSAVCGSAIFLYLYGVYPLALSNLGWIYLGQDTLQHFLGWQFFRAEPWTFPLGKISSYGYPFGVYLSYTDSIPLAAIVLKLFNPLLQDRFQYLGLWTLICFILQFFFGLLILRELTAKRIFQGLGAALLAISPPMIYRTFYHTSLASHWLILLGIYLVLAGRRKRLPVWAWGLALVLAVTIHPYFLPMLGPLYLVYLAETFERERRLLPLLAELAGAGAGVGLVGYAIGLFALGSSDLAAAGFGTYSFNLNGLFNSFGTSRFFAELPVFHYHQEEGYNYLGLGLILLVGAALISILLRGIPRRALLGNKYLAVACLGWAAFAISSTVTWNDSVLLNLPLPDFALRGAEMFRSSGRFFWPVFYLLVVLALARLGQKARLAQWLLAAALVAQLLDLQPLIEGKRFHDYRAYTSPLQSGFWDEAAGAFAHLQILPAYRQANGYAPFAIYAANHQLTLNWGYFARASYNEIRAYGEDQTQALRAGSPDPASLYVFCNSVDVNDILTSAQNRLAVYRVDDYFVGFSQDSPLAQPGTAWSQDRVQADEMAAETLNRLLGRAKASQVFFLIGKGHPLEGLDSVTAAALRDLGLEVQIDPLNADSWIAIVGKSLGRQSVLYQSAGQLDEFIPRGTRLGRFELPFDLRLRSAGLEVGNYASVEINGKEYAHNKPGLNVIYYDMADEGIRSISYTRGYRVACP